MDDFSYCLQPGITSRAQLFEVGDVFLRRDFHDFFYYLFGFCVDHVDFTGPGFSLFQVFL